MYKVTIEKKYQEIVFNFEHYLDASDFIKKLLLHSEEKLSISITYEEENNEEN